MLHIPMFRQALHISQYVEDSTGESDTFLKLYIMFTNV